MKHFSFRILYSLLIFSLASCGSDDDNDPYAGIPSGEIVDLEMRDEVLSGSGSSGGRFAVGQKWWKHLNGEIRYNGTCDEETESLASTTDVYYGFYSSNQFFTKDGIDGTPELSGSWQWVDNNTKEALFINYAEFNGLELELRALNNDELTYLSEVVNGECTELTWEHLGESHTE